MNIKDNNMLTFILKLTTYKDWFVETYVVSLQVEII